MFLRKTRCLGHYRVVAPFKSDSIYKIDHMGIIVLYKNKITFSVKNNAPKEPKQAKVNNYNRLNTILPQRYESIKFDCSIICMYRLPSDPPVVTFVKYLTIGLSISIVVISIDMRNCRNICRYRQYRTTFDPVL